MAGYTVTAPLVLVRDTGGVLRYAYAGDPVPADADEEAVGQLLKDGFIAEVADPAPAGKPAASRSGK